MRFIRTWGLPQSGNVSVSNMVQRTVFPVSAKSRDSPHTTHENSSERIWGPYLENQLSYLSQVVLVPAAKGARQGTELIGQAGSGKDSPERPAQLTSFSEGTQEV